MLRGPHQTIVPTQYFTSLQETPIITMPVLTRASKRAAVSSSPPPGGETRLKRRSLRIKSAKQEAVQDAETSEFLGWEGIQADEPSVADSNALLSGDERSDVAQDGLSLSSDEEDGPVCNRRRPRVRERRYTVVDSSDSGLETESDPQPPLKDRLRRRKTRSAVPPRLEIDGETSDSMSAAEATHRAASEGSDRDSDSESNVIANIYATRAARRPVSSLRVTEQKAAKQDPSDDYAPSSTAPSSSDESDFRFGDE